jgi:hypothetical protein
MWFSTSSGRIELNLSRADAEAGYHSGACDEDIAHLIQFPHIATQLDQISPELLRAELREYGAWDDEELADHRANRERLLWLACGDLIDRETEDED